MRLFQKLRAARSRYYEKKRILKYRIKTIWFHHYKVDLGIAPRWSLREKIKYNRLGFTNEDYFNFDLKQNDYHNYISYWERLKLEDINGRFADILGEKLLFERIFGRYIQIPHIFCWIKNGKCIDLDAGAETDILSILRDNHTLIAKPTRSVGGGTGIHRIEKMNELLTVDEKAVSQQELVMLVSSWEEYIVVEYVHQAKYSDLIFSDTTNSIRIVTALRQSGTIEVLFAFHRFGSEMSKPVDNISSGGLVSLIDVASGILGKAKRKTEPGHFHAVHPDTQAQIEGVVIPNWRIITDKLLHVHRCFPYFKFFAWDVVIDENGNPQILEINRGSDLGIQMIQPMRNEKMGDFMRDNGLLDHR